MLPRVLALVVDLRQAGVAVSNGEVLDAVHALEVLPIGDRSVVQHALRTTLVKASDHRERFDVLFDRHFPSMLDDSGSRVDRDRGSWEIDDDPLSAAAASDGAELRTAAEAAVQQHAGMGGGRFLGVEYHVQRVLRRTGAVGGLVVAVGATLEEQLEARARELRREQVEEAVRHQVRALAAEQQPVSRVVRDPAELALLQCGPEEQVRLRRATATLARRLATRMRRRRNGERGRRLLVGATMRHAMATGGVPFSPRFRAIRPHRPDLIVLADVSGSVATFSRFTLQLVHALSSQLGSVRTFVFVDEVDEVSSMFRKGLDVVEALQLVDERAATLGEHGHSDYGAVWERWERRWGKSVRPGATVLVLGDARTNYHPAKVDAFARIAGRARRTYWLDPEPRTEWDTGDSMLRPYAAHCDAVFECRNLAQLRAAIDAIA